MLHQWSLQRNELKLHGETVTWIIKAQLLSYYLCFNTKRPKVLLLDYVKSCDKHSHYINVATFAETEQIYLSLNGLNI